MKKLLERMSNRKTLIMGNNPKAEKTVQKFMWAVLLALTLFNIFYVFPRGWFKQDDWWMLYTWGKNINAFSTTIDVPPHPIQRQGLRLIQKLFLHYEFKLFGLNYPFYFLANFVLFYISLYILYQTVKSLSNKTVAYLSIALYALALNNIFVYFWYAIMGSMTFYTILFLGMFLAFFTYLKQRRWYLYLISIFLYGLSLLTYEHLEWDNQHILSLCEAK